MFPQGPTEIAFDRSFGLWRGALDDLARARRTVETLERKEADARTQMIAARDALAKGAGK